MTKMVMLRVTGAASRRRGAGRGEDIAENNLVKCSWYGSDPYWGRLLGAAGSAGVAFDSEKRASPMAASPSRAAASRSRMIATRSPRHMKSEQIEIEVDLGTGGGTRPGDRDRPRPRLHQGEFGHVMSSADATPALTARILVQALPYIQRFRGKTVIVKLGGAAIDAELDRALAQDVLLLRSVGVRCVLVHGGGPQVDAMMGGRQGAGVPRRPARHRRRNAARSSAWCWSARSAAISSRRSTGIARRSGRGRRRGRGWRAADHHAARPRPRLRRRCAQVRAERLHGLLDQGLAPVVSTVGADRVGPALQYQRRRGGDGDRGGDGGREDRLSHRRARPARGSEGRVHA